MAESVTGLVLVSASSSEQQAIAGLPGLWSTEAELSVVPADLGLDVEELADLAYAAGIEVETVEWSRETVADDDGTKLTVDEVRERIETFSLDELDALADDDRKGVQEAATREIARRAEPDAGEPEETS